MGPSCGKAQSCSGLSWEAPEPLAPQSAPACVASAGPMPGTAQSCEAWSGPTPEGRPVPEPPSVQLLLAALTTAGPITGMAHSAEMLGAPDVGLLLPEFELVSPLLFDVLAAPDGVLLELPQPDKPRKLAESRKGITKFLIFIENACYFFEYRLVRRQNTMLRQGIQ